jgi:hypothetical protein
LALLASAMAGSGGRITRGVVVVVKVMVVVMMMVLNVHDWLENYIKRH